MPGGERRARIASIPTRQCEGRSGDRHDREGRRDSRGTSALIDEIFGETRETPSPPAAPGLPSPTPNSLDVRLEDAVRDLTRLSATESAVAWRAAENGEGLLVASEGPEDPSVIGNLDSKSFAALRQLSRACDPRGGDLEIPTLAGERGWHVAAAVGVGRGGDDAERDAPAVLAIGGGIPGMKIRPRSLAILEEVGRRLDAPRPTSSTWGHAGDPNAELSWLDRRAALGEILGEVVHEVRNPLLSIKTFLQLLPDRLQDADFMTQFRGVVLGEVSRLERLLDSVLQVGRPGRVDSNEEVARVAESMETVVRLLTHRATRDEIGLVYELAPDIEDVEISPDALTQVLLNLILNALTITPTGGRVVLSGHRLENAGKRWVVIRVDDDGPGIAESERHKLFTAFHSTRSDRPGGLGLMITRRLIEEVGGEIQIEDAPGGGARLSLRLPACPRTT